MNATSGFDADTLVRLLPAIHRVRDAAQAPPEPLAALFAAFAEEIAAMEENLEQLYDDLFIETCAGWAVPYIGDLIGYEPLHGLGRGQGLARAEVAHTIALRRRKGTVPVLEQLAYDVTAWRAHAVEYFQRLGWTQYMNHLRPLNTYAPDLRRWEPLARINGPFESTAHTVEVRRIESGRGRYNIPNVGIWLWRLGAYPHTQSPAVRVDDRRWLANPLGAPLQLFTHPLAEDEITQLAEPINVPDPIGRRTLASRLARYYGTRGAPTEPLDNAEPSIVLFVNGVEVPRTQVVACDLRDDGAAAWAHVPPDGRYAIDPVLGRIAVAADLPVPDRFAISYHYGFSADLGGGEYSRSRVADAPGTTVVRVPADQPTIQAALAALGGDGVVEIADSGRYEETFAIAVNADGHVRLRAADQCRPTIVLGAPLQITGGANGECTLDGLLVAGQPVQVPAAGNELAHLRLVHLTLVPALGLDAGGDPVAPGEPSVVVELANAVLVIDHSIVGALRVDHGASVVAADSIVDAIDAELPAFIAPDETDPGGALSLDACTVIGSVAAREMPLVSNSLLLARRASGASQPAVRTEQRQTGCVRFTYLPFDSLTPRRYRCQPDVAEGVSRIVPRFTSLRYGVAAYCQLGRTTPDEIRRGADDESEMGAFHALFAPQRETNLQIRLGEYLRVGLAAGIVYAT